jgi:glycosyltransferase involved in cell wall biosynthesis
VGNGVEYQLFVATRYYDRPVDLPQGKPVVGYVGAIYPWLDYQLLQTVCSDMGYVNFVFIGPTHPGVSSGVKALKALPNVYFLGVRPYPMIPAYLHYLDVGMIPFLKNELTAGVNPVKLYEYSASGKPSVVTDFSEDVVRVKDRVYVAATAEGFVSCIREALDTAKDPLRIESLLSFARSHDWERKTTAIIELIESRIVPSAAG